MHPGPDGHAPRSLRTNRNDTVLLTGATGFLGHYLLRELLAMNVRVVVLVRAPLEGASARVRHMLQEIGCDAERPWATGQVRLVEGDICDTGWHDAVGSIDSVVHCAGSTCFEERLDREPYRTNVTGTQNLLAWMTRAGIGNLHLVSTAFSCGRSTGMVREQIQMQHPDFRNAYEESKWRGEILACEWQRATGGVLTVHRPSIIVGDSITGRATRFSGFYITLRACDFVNRLALETNDGLRAFEVVGDPEARPNLIQVDYAASISARIVADRQWHGRVYNIVHPAPSCNAEISRAISACFQGRPIRFVPEAAAPSDDLEATFHRMQEAVQPYLLASPTFERANVGRVERHYDLQAPQLDEHAIARIIDFAKHASWRPLQSTKRLSRAEVDSYFFDFLPRNIRRSVVAGVNSLTTTVRFIVEGNREDQWVCCFERGALVRIHRGQNGIREDFSYRTDPESFWEVVSGRRDPQSVFLDGRAEIHGNHEDALKMGTLLQQFARECPFPQGRAEVTS